MKIKFPKLATVATILIATVIAIAAFDRNDGTGVLKVNFLNVGQGDSSLIILPTNDRIMIDTGNDYGVLSSVSERLPFYDSTIDYLILTHPDLDHVGMYRSISQEFNLKRIIISSIHDFTKVIEMNSIRPQIATMKSSSTLILSDKSLESISLQNISFFNTISNENSNSIVTILNYAGFSFVFTGDIDVEAERDLISRGNMYINGKVILKVAHHGSKTSSSEAFLKKLAPEYCILSVGRNNKYGHPDEEVLSRLKRHCKNILNTSTEGDIEFKVDAGRLKVVTDNKNSL